LLRVTVDDVRAVINIAQQMLFPTLDHILIGTISHKPISQKTQKEGEA